MAAELREEKDIAVTNSINVFPNPVRDQATLKFDFGAPRQVEVNTYNLLGQRVFTRNLQAEKDQINLNFSYFPAGLYIVEVKAGSEQYTKKVVKR